MRRSQPKVLGKGLFLVIILAIAAIVIFSLDQRIEAASACPRHLLIKLADNEIPIHPIKVVVDPWQGRHRVYGIFMVSPQQLSRRNVVVNITGSGSGAGKYCGGVSHPSIQFDDVVAVPGHYLIKGFLRTRTSFWLLSKGLAKKLQDPKNWRLI